MESARYFDKDSGQEIKGYDALKKKGLIKRLANSESSMHTLTAYKISDNVRVEPYFKQRV